MVCGRRGNWTWLVMWWWWLPSLVTTQETPSSTPSLLPHMPGRMGEVPLVTLDDLDTYMDSLTELARLHISKAFTEESRLYRRSLDMKSVKVIGTQLAQFDLEGSVGDGSSWMNQVTGLHLLTRQHTSYWILGGPRNEYQRVVAWSAVDQTMRVIARFQLTSTSIVMVNRIAAHIYSGFLVLALGSSSSRLVSIVCINLQTGLLRMPHTIPSRGVVGGLHIFEAAGRLYLVVGEHYYTTLDDGVTQSAMYVMVGEYFDHLEGLQLRASGVRDITGFTDGGNYYLIFGMKSTEGSQVYEFNTVMNRVTLIQQLPHTDVKKVLHYRDPHDDKHYVLVLNSDATPTIYWWSSDQMQEWQQLVNSEAVGSPNSAGILVLHNLESIILISNGGTITLYTDDMTGHYSATFTLHTTCITVEDLHGVRLGPDYYIFYVCTGTVNRLEARLLHLETVVLGKEETEGDPLLRCLEQLTTMLGDRKKDIAYLESVVTSDALMTVDHPQTWGGPVGFSELWVNGKTTAYQTIVIGKPEEGSFTNQSIEEYNDAITKLQTEVYLVKEQLSSVLYHSGAQTITGPIKATSLSIDTVYFDALILNKVNGVPLANIDQMFLMDGADQTIEGLWRANYLSMDVLNTRTRSPPGTISGILTSDLMRRSVMDQVVTGHHIYETIVADEICNRMCNNFSININGVDTSTIVIMGSDVTFLDKKTFPNMMVTGTMDIETINNVVLSQLASQVVYTDLGPKLTLVGNYTLGRVTVRGNVAAFSINGINVVELDSSVVKKYGNYRMAGGLVYREDLVVTNSVVSETINDVLWSNIVDRSSSDKITGTYHFSEVTVTGSLDSDDINGLDPSEEAVLVDMSQTINGRIKFQESVSVTGVEGVVMEEGGTVNNVDPSSLQPEFGGMGDLIIDQETSFSRPLLLSGSVTARRVNGLMLDNLGGRYWRKSLDQDINVYVHLNNAVFESAVTGETLNGWMMSDFLHKRGQQVVSTDYIFQGGVVVQGNLLMAKGSTVDQVDVSELLDNVVTLQGYQTITGQMNFLGKVSIVGDLDLRGLLNGLDIATDLMRLDKNLPQTGQLTFMNKVDMMTLNVINIDMTVESLNGLDVEAAAGDLVLLGQDATIMGAGGLRFTGDVHVNKLMVKGMVDGVDIENMVNRALKKSSDTPQHVTSSVTVEGDVHFVQELSLGTVNGEDWTRHLNNVVLLNYSGEIVGRKIFTRPLYIQGDFYPKTINGIDVSALAARILRRSGEQVVYGAYTFTSDVVAEELVAPVIDGVNMDTIMLVDEGGHVGGTVTFAKDVSFVGLTSDTNVLDGCNVGKLQNGAIWKDHSDMMIDSVVIIDTLVVEGDAYADNVWAMKSGNIVDVNHFLKTLVLKSSDQVITAKMQFLNDVHIGHLQVDTINNVDINELFRSSVMQNEDMDIVCDISFTKGLTVKNLEVKAALSGRGGGGVLVNGVDVSDIHARAVLANGGSVVITGLKSFLNGFSVNHLNAVRVGGVAVRDLVVLSGGLAVTQHLIFTAPIAVLGHLLVSGSVDGEDLSYLFSTRVLLDATQTLLGFYTFENIVIEGDLEVSVINNVSISDLVLRYGSDHQVVSGTKILRGGLHVYGDIIASTVNGIDFWNLNNSLVIMDNDVTFTAPVTFENLVTCLVKVDVTDRVNGLDMLQLSRDIVTVKEKISNQYHKIDLLLRQFGSLNEENYMNARELYAELSYLERMEFPRDTEVYGELWVGHIATEGEDLFLKIISCPNPPCGCDTECHYYKVKGNGWLEPVAQLSIKVDVVNHPLNDQHFVAIYSRCENGQPIARVDIDYYLGTSPIATYDVMGMVSGTGLFIINEMNYLVVMLQVVDGTDATEKTVIFVLKLDAVGKRIINTWSREFTKKAAGMDLALIDNTWFLLVASNYDPMDKVTPYTVTSELFIWEMSSEMFTMVGEYVADHTSSGMFLTVDMPVGESFFTLAQLKEADSVYFPDNVKYTAQVLVFRYNKVNKNFEAFQSLAAFGVVDQTLLVVDNSVYLLLVSTVHNCLYVFEYYHPEGFLLVYKIYVENPYSLIILEVEDCTLVAVSTSNGLVRFKVHIKGVDPDSLLIKI